MGFGFNVPSCFLLVALHLGTSGANRVHIQTSSEHLSQPQALQKVRGGSELDEMRTPAASKQSEEASALLVAERGTTEEATFTLAFREFLGMSLFVFFGCGSAMSVANRNSSNTWILQVALSFGFAIFVLLEAGIANEINCAVTLGLTIEKQLSLKQGVCNLMAQLLGSMVGAAILKVMFPIDKDFTGGLGSNTIVSGWTFVGAFIGEFIGTFLLMLVVLAAGPSKHLANLAIGLAVFLAHSVLIPVDGCSINPTRSFGPAVIQAVTSKHTDALMQLWIFWIGPLSGAACATLAHHLCYQN